MICKTYNCNSFNIHTIKTDKFKTAHMEIIFRKNAIKENMCSDAFLVDYLSEASKKYPKSKDLIVRFEELYRASCYAMTTRTGNILNTSFILDFINPEFINEEDYLENVLSLPFELLQDANMHDGECNIKQFNLIKERLKKEINSLKENPVKLSIRNALEASGLTSPISYPLLGTIEDLDKITPSSIYKTYRHLLKDNTCDIFIIGSLDMDLVVDIIKKKFKNRYIHDYNLTLNVHNELAKKVIYKEEESDNIQANLVMIYNCSNLLKREKDITMQAFNYLFGSGGLTSKLYQALREKNSLCYGVKSMYLKNDDLLLVQVSLDNQNVKKAINLIKRELKEMQKGNFSIDELNDAINNMIMSIDLATDNNVSILNNQVFHILYDFPSLDERKKLYKEMQKEEVIEVSKKIKLNTIYCLLGRDNNGNS